MSVRRNVSTRGSAFVTLVLGVSLLTVLPGGTSLVSAATASEVTTTKTRLAKGSTTGAEKFRSPSLPDKVEELPAGSDVVAPGRAWTDVEGVPVEVRASDEVTVLPDSPEAAATTEPIKSESAGAVPVEVSVEPSDEVGTPALIVDVEKDDAPAAPETPRDAAEAVEVRLSYADFRHAFGADWGGRLQVTAYPSCFLTRPNSPRCGHGVVVPSVNDSSAETVTFTTTDLDAASPELRAGVGRSAPMVVPAAPPSGGTTYVVSASPAGQVGNFGAEPIKPSAAWQVGEGSGDFTYSYPFSLPAPAVGGSAPSVGLSYSSGSVDGMNMAENGQASMMGLGWDLSTAYITREYVACNDDGHTAMGDLCWKTTGDGLVTQYSIVLNGHATRLVRDSDGTLRLQDDPGWQVDQVLGQNGNGNLPDNADPTNEAIRVQTPDGTEYWFGWGHGSDSVLTVPVFGDDPGEPCHDSTIASSWCMQAWRWGLDKVIDRKGNVTLYNYTVVPNYYSRLGDTSTAGRQVYDRDGYLSSITYGRSRGGETAYTAVELTKRPRCIDALTDDATACTGTRDPQSAPDNWPDVPSDLLCESTGTCLNASPSFFSTARYDKIITRRISGSSIYDVDTYQLNFQLPSNANDNPGNQSLWLSSIQRTGQDGTDITLPKVVFEGTWLQNRVTVPVGGSKFLRLRVNSIRTETGARIDVEYGHDDGRTCDPTYVDTLGHDDSLRECYPRKLVNDNWEWWHKYVVKRVGLGDDALGYRLGQSPDTSLSFGRLRVFDYEYVGEPGWRHRPSPLTPAEDETWDDWRGYGDVVVHTRQVGSNQVVDEPAVDLSRRVVTTFRGLAGSKIDDPGSDDIRHDTVTTLEDTYADNSWLNGRVAEEVTYSPTGLVLSRTSNEYGQFQTADFAFGLDGRHVYQSRKVVVPRTDAPERITTWEVNDGGTSHHGKKLGAIEVVRDNGGTAGTTVDDVYTCNAWIYSATTALLVPMNVITRAGVGGCAGNVVGHTDYFYDGDDVGGAAPTDGDATYTTVYTDATEANRITTKTTWDGYGRVQSEHLPVYGGPAQADASEYTQHEYNPNGSAHAMLVSKKTSAPPAVSGAARLATTEQFTFARGQVKDSGDANGNHTTAAYDALGRTSDVWLPGRALANPSVSHTYRDAVDNEGRVGTTTLRAIANGNPVYDTTYDFYDGWGRPIQSSTLNQDFGGTNPRMATMTAYDEVGRTWLSAAPFAIGPVVEAVVPTLASTPHYFETEFDAAGRPTKVAEKSVGWEKRWTKYTYTADADGVALMPAGAAENASSVSKTRTTYNPRFQVVSVSQYANGTSPDASLDDGYAEYTYTPTGLLDTIKTPTAAGGAGLVTYDYDYDRLGRKTQATDPDTGTTDYTYDAMGNTLTVDDQAPGVGLIATSYDRLGRPTERKHVYEDSSPADVLAEWTYDTDAANGKGKLAQTVSHTDLGDFTTKVDGYTGRGNAVSSTQTYPASLTGEPGDPNGNVSKTTSFTYNELGQVVTTGYPTVPGLSGHTVNTSYGTHGTFGGMTTGTRTLADPAYDELNRPLTLLSKSSASDGFGLKRYYNWSTDDRLTDIAGRGLSTDGVTWFEQLKFSYVYDTAGNPTQVTGKRRDFQTPNTTYYGAWCYQYDGISRLTEAKTAVGTSTGTTCAAPAAGTETTHTLQLTGQVYDLDYSYAQTRLSAVSNGSMTASYGYLATHPHAPATVTTSGPGGGSTAGLPSPGTYTYDAVGHADEWFAPSGATTDYIYDAQGNLTKSDASGSGTDIENAFDVDGIRVARRSTTGTTPTTTVYVAGAEITRVGTATATSRRTITTPGGTPLAIQASDGPDSGSADDWTWLFADAQDTIRLTKNADTGAVSNHTYSPYGDPISAQSTLPGERGYLGKPHDPDGTVRLDHRSYDPGMNTLITPDPLMTPTDPQNLNAYAYSGNNPLAFSDPSGLERSPNMPQGCSPTVQNCGPKGDGSSNPEGQGPPPPLPYGINDAADSTREQAEAEGGDPDEAEKLFLQGVMRQTSPENADQIELYYCAKLDASYCESSLPDYVTINLSYLPLGVGGGVNFTVTRHGQVYVGVEGAVGLPGASLTIRGGWIDQEGTPTASETDGFVAGWSNTGSGYVPLWGGVAGPTVGQNFGHADGTQATEAGVGLGVGHYVGVSWGYNFQIFPGW